MGRKNLREYDEQRDFEATPEPKGGKKKGDKRIFVVQQHDATSMHWDFRLEVDGTLKSWAVPKGPSTDPREKRLAMPTEDHPMDYADFEGVIPEGEYGAGPVIVWDRGTYDNLREEDGDEVPMADCLEQGQVEVFLHGDKLEGGYALVRTGKDGQDRRRWLLIKMRDDHADARRNPTSTEPESVVSGKTIDELREQAEAEEDGGDGD